MSSQYPNEPIAENSGFWVNPLLARQKLSHSSFRFLSDIQKGFLSSLLLPLLCPSSSGPLFIVVVIAERRRSRAVSATPAQFPMHVFGTKAKLCHRGMTEKRSE